MMLLKILQNLQKSTNVGVSFSLSVKRITLCNCLCSSSPPPSSRFSSSRHVQNIGAIRIWHFCCCTASLSCRKMDSAIVKKNSSVKPGFSLQKICLWFFGVQCKLSTFNIFQQTFNFVVIYNQLFICLCIHLSIYFTYLFIWLYSWR